MKDITYYKSPSSLSEFIKITAEIQEESWGDKARIFPWFRGHSDSNFKLIPGLYRSKGLSDRIEEEYSYRDDFKLKAQPFLHEAYNAPRDDWERYLLMQHYGLPTRLLDWTEGSLFALFFALSNAKEGIDSCVWVLNPFMMNKLLAGYDEIHNYDDRKLKKYMPEIGEHESKLPSSPVAFAPLYNSKRINAQKGVFTIHGNKMTSLENWPGAHKFLKKIIIKSKYFDVFNLELITTGVGYSVLFPELSGLSRDIVSKWGKKF